MYRTEIEATLDHDRVWLLETYAMLPSGDLERGVTKSEHDPSSMWSPKDHLAHLAGIEHNFVRMIRRHVEGDPNPVGLRQNADGTARTMEQIMATVHEMTEDWVREHRSKTLAEVVTLGQKARAETLALLAELTDAQLAEKLPGAPWADGTIGGVLATNAMHGRMHWGWVKEGMRGLGISPPR
ncbi:MAG: DinB family protein [Chloroflexi bacterium]|nr:DinB family protein [Chloroflexota bacterium]